MLTPVPPLSVTELEARDLPAAAFDTRPVLPAADPAVLDHARAVLLLGQQLGHRADAFIRFGDSNSASPGYLTPLGEPGYNPVASGLAAAHPELLPTLATFQSPVDGFGANSFSRASLTAVPATTLDRQVQGLAAELATTRAGLALIMVGTNEITTLGDPVVFRAKVQALVDTLLGQGVLPVLSTIPEYTGPFVGYRPLVPTFNQVIADVAAEDRLPLWNLWRVVETLPGEGLRDGIHLNVSPNGGGSFTPVDLLFGQNVRNLEALQVLDWFRKQVVGGVPEAVPTLGWTPLQPGQSVYAVGRGAGQQPVVSVYDAGTGQELNRFLAFDSGFTGGVRVATADVTGDGIPDVVVGAGPGGGPVVRVFSGADGSLARSFFAFEPSFRTGVNVAAADLDGDGAAEVVVGAGDGGGPVVAVYHGRDLGEVNRFFAFEPSFRGGVTVAAGTVSRFGPAVVAGAGNGGGPVVKVFPFGSGTPAATYMVYGPDDRGGVGVAVADLDGDGIGDLITVPAAGASHVRVLDAGTGGERASFFAAPDGASGVTLGVLRRGPGNPDVLLVGNGPGSAVAVRWYLGLDGQAGQLPPDDPGRAFGVFVG